MGIRKINESTLTAIGNAIRSKTGGSALINPEDMASEIESITTGGGLDFIDMDEGEITVSTEGQTTLTINHNLGVVPFCCMIYPKTVASYSGKHVWGGISFFVSKNSIAEPNGITLRSRSSRNAYAKDGLYSESGYTMPAEEIPNDTVDSNYVKNFTATSFQLTASSAYPIGVGTYRWRALAFNSNL